VTKRIHMALVGALVGLLAAGAASRAFVMRHTSLKAKGR